jgi:putative heme iron utilization protein
MAANQEPEFIARAAALLLAARAGTLATVNAGLPYAALVTPALDAQGHPLLLLSDLSAHTKHLRENPACALLVTGAPADANPQTAPRVTLRARAEICAEPETRAAYLRIHPYAELYANFGDFNFWRLFVNDAHFVGGFAAAAALDIAALQHEIKSAMSKGYG